MFVPTKISLPRVLDGKRRYLHATGGYDVYDIGNEIDAFGYRLQLFKENCKDVTDTRENLHHVVEPNDSRKKLITHT